MLARRKGQRWYIGGIDGDASGRKLHLDLSFLGEGRFSASVIADGANDDSFAEATTTFPGTTDCRSPCGRAEVSWPR